MPRSQVRRKQDSTKLDLFSIRKPMHVCHRSNWNSPSILWISFLRAASFQNRRTPLAGYDSRAAQPLEFSNTACMIKVRVRIHNDFYVAHEETEFPDVCRNLPGRVRKSAINDDVARLRRNQNRAQAMSPNVVGIAKNSEWPVRAIPLRAPGAAGGAGLRNSRNRGRQDDQQIGEKVIHG